jgi:hypothetical protein
MTLDTDEKWNKITLVRQANAASSGSISDAVYDLYTAPLPLKPKKIRDLAKFKVRLHTGRRRRILTQTHTYTLAYTYRHTDQASTHIYTHRHMRTHVLVYTDIQIHRYIHASIHSYTYTQEWLPHEFHGLYPDPSAAESSGTVDTKTEEEQEDQEEQKEEEKDAAAMEED